MEDLLNDSDVGISRFSSRYFIIEKTQFILETRYRDIRLKN